MRCVGMRGGRGWWIWVECVGYGEVDGGEGILMIRKEVEFFSWTLDTRTPGSEVTSSSHALESFRPLHSYDLTYGSVIGSVYSPW